MLIHCCDWVAMGWKDGKIGWERHTCIHTHSFATTKTQIVKILHGNNISTAQVHGSYKLCSSSYKQKGAFKLWGPQTGYMLFPSIFIISDKLGQFQLVTLLILPSTFPPKCYHIIQFTWKLSVLQISCFENHLLFCKSLLLNLPKNLHSSICTHAAKTEIS